MNRRVLRLLSATAWLACLLAPVAWTGPICADDWADLTAPTDDPSMHFDA